MRLSATILLLLFSSIVLFSQNVDIPDPVFLEALIDEGVDLNGDGVIQVSEAERVTILELGTFNSQLDNMRSAEGIEAFTRLRTFELFANNVSEIDLSNSPILETLVIESSLEQVDFTNNRLLRNLKISNGEFTSIDLSQNAELETLYVGFGSNLTSIDLSENRLLTRLILIDSEFDAGLDLSQNQLLNSFYLYNSSVDSLDLSNNTNLYILDIQDSSLDNIDLRSNHLLSGIIIDSTSLFELDLSGCHSLEGAYINNPNLSQLFLKNGNPNTSVCLNGNEGLQYICVDENRIDEFVAIASEIGAVNCVVGTFCSFNPGGRIHNLSGDLFFGADCDEQLFNDLTFKISDGLDDQYLITGNSGDYSVSLPEGSYTVTPMLQNQSLFDINPPIINLDFPQDGDSILQDICLIAREEIVNLGIAIIPQNDARPGFEATYKIIYRNNGTAPRNARIELSYEEDLVTFVSAGIDPNDNSNGLLTWDVDELGLFEVREFEVTMRLNSPMDNPALNGGDFIRYEAVILPIDNFDPTDNRALLNQQVVNSFDPNDKTCLEGETIAPEFIGEYVHYQIRFENTGTAEAINVVVQDEINTAQFDVSTLQIVDTSHPMVTNIKDGNLVEFIFEDINLPFDDANNDGYLVFKIKTLPTLELGDNISNAADIFFDFNFPIVTDDAVTFFRDEISSVGELNTNSSVLVYPNPTSQVFNIKSDIPLSKIEMLDLNGKVIIDVDVPALEETSLDVSKITSGIYYVKLYSDFGIAVKEVVVR